MFISKAEIGEKLSVYRHAVVLPIELSKYALQCCREQLGWDEFHLSYSSESYLEYDFLTLFV